MPRTDRQADSQVTSTSKMTFRFHTLQPGLGLPIPSTGVRASIKQHRPRIIAWSHPFLATGAPETHLNQRPTDKAILSDLWEAGRKEGTGKRVGDLYLRRKGAMREGLNISHVEGHL